MFAPDYLKSRPPVNEGCKATWLDAQSGELLERLLEDHCKKQIDLELACYNQEVVADIVIKFDPRSTDPRADALSCGLRKHPKALEHVAQLARQDGWKVMTFNCGDTWMITFRVPEDIRKS